MRCRLEGEVRPEQWKRVYPILRFYKLREGASDTVIEKVLRQFGIQMTAAQRKALDQGH